MIFKKNPKKSPILALIWNVLTKIMQKLTFFHNTLA
nr:MAG TPA: hypothetical protein [Caudoviricetes sp.]